MEMCDVFNGKGLNTLLSCECISENIRTKLTFYRYCCPDALPWLSSVQQTWTVWQFSPSVPKS